MSTHSTKSIENLLRASFDGPIPDNGFCERVMLSLPVRRAHRNWPVPASIIAGIFACWMALTSSSLMRVASQSWASGKLSTTILILLAAISGMSLLATWWAMAEAE